VNSDPEDGCGPENACLSRNFNNLNREHDDFTNGFKGHVFREHHIVNNPQLVV
jgi:hypothetical protein